MRHKRLFSLLAILTLLISLAVAAPAASGDGSGGFDIPPKPQLRYPNLGYSLNQQIDAVENQGLSAALAAAESPVHSGGSVAVTIYLSGNVDGVVDFLEANGGDPRNVGEDYIEAYVPLTLLGSLSQQPGVTRVREIVRPEPLFGNVTSQAVELHLAEAWHDEGYTGKGVRVGIIDDFAGFSGIMGVELPTNANVVARCYTDIGLATSNLADCETVPDVPDTIPPQCHSHVEEGLAGGYAHGTAVAEAVIDIAPDVTLYITNPGTRADLQDAVAWMAREDVTVINYSVGWVFDGPGDGTSPFSFSPLNTVDQAVANGITWVNSAGNSADSTLFGSYSDPDGDRVLGFSSQNDEVIDLTLRKCHTFSIQLRWEDSWGGASTDLDVYLYHKVTNRFLPCSVDEQSGGSGHIPFEACGFRSLVTSRDVNWGVVVNHADGPVPDWVQLTMWGPYGLEYYTSSGSITNPAESANPGLLAVGAAPYYDIDSIEPFSSQGPAPDGRLKPDIVGVDCAASVTYEKYIRSNGQDIWFCGTSQASPHVAGLAALVLQQNPRFDPAQVAHYLKSNAAERGIPGPDNVWGHGFAQLPPPELGAAFCVKALTDDGPVTGTWAAGCESSVRQRGHAQYYTFKLDEDSEVTITLESEDADTYLYLREGNARSRDVIADNDDIEPSSNLNSRIRQTLAAGTYTIEATTYGTGDTGDYTLTVERQGDAVVLPPSDDCGQTLSEDGETDGEWAAGCESQTRAPRQGSGARLARYYTFSLSESSDVTITLESDTDPYLYLRKDDARSGIFITENDDIEYGRNLNSRIRQTLEAGDYTIEATTYKAGETGNFTLSISGLSETGAPVDDCGQILSEDGEIPGEWTADCESQTRAPRQGSGTWLARYYTFSLNESSGVTITLESDEADAYLYLRRDNARSGEPVNDPAADNDIEYESNLNSRIHLMLGAGTYTIEATTYKAGETGSFTLTLTVAGLTSP